MYIYIYIYCQEHVPTISPERVLNRNTTFRQEGVPDTSLGKGSKHAFRWGSDMLCGRGSGHIVRKGFLTCCVEDVLDTPSGRGHDMPLGKGF